MTAPQPAPRDIVPAEVLARLRGELTAALAAREEQLRESTQPDDISFAFRGINEKTLEDVSAALERMDAGTYGICERCQGVISTARLEAVPQTRFCVGCAAK